VAGFRERQQGSRKSAERYGSAAATGVWRMTIRHVERMS
jgi:hypothetical protein